MAFRASLPVPLNLALIVVCNTLQHRDSRDDLKQLWPQTFEDVGIAAMQDTQNLWNGYASRSGTSTNLFGEQSCIKRGVATPT
jgi:hypothetical protein